MKKVQESNSIGGRPHHFFSKSTTQETMNVIIAIAGIQTSHSFERYIGVPALIGRCRIVRKNYIIADLNINFGCQ